MQKTGDTSCATHLSATPSSPLPDHRTPPDRDREEKYHLIFKHSPVGIIHFDSTGQITDCNDRFADIIGAPKNSIFSFHLARSLTDPRMKEAAAAVLRGEVGYFEGDYTSVLSGKEMTIKVVFGPLMAENGSVGGGIGIFEDITPRMKIKTALEEEKNKSQAIIAAIGDGISIQDTSFRVLYQNEVSKTIIGNHIGEYCYRAYEKRVGVCDDCPLAIVFKNGGIHRTERRTMTRDGIRHLDITASPLRDAEGIIIGGIEVARDITERKAVEGAIRESEERYRDLFENANDPIFIVDADHRYIDVNRRAIKVFGYTKEEFLRMSIFDIIPPEQADRSRIEFQKLANEGYYEKFIGRVRAKDGRWLTVEVSSSAIVRDGKVVGSRDIVRDVTDRKRAEAALQESEERFRMLFDNAPDAEFLADIETGMIVDANAAACRLLLLSRDQIIGLHQTELHPPRAKDFSSETFGGHVDQTMHGERTSPVENAVLRSDGEEVPVEVMAQRIVLQGKPVLYGIFRDISKRKRAENFVKNILETVDEGFIVIDRDYTILSANKAYSTQAGRPLAEITGKKCHEISHGIFRPCYEHGEKCAVRKTFETGEPATELHTHYDNRKNPIYVETKSFPVKDGAGRVTAAIEIVNNITEKKRLEDQLRHAQKMEAVGLLAGGVAHDFNNILTAIIGYGNLLEMKLPQDDQLRMYVDQILASSARAANLTQSLLAFSRKQVIDPRVVDVNEIISRIERLLQRVIGEDIDLKTSLAPGGLTIMADSNQVEQVLMNLATNARDAMPEGGTLTIKTGTGSIDEAFRKAKGFGKDGTYATMTVSDTGAGMDERTLERIFEPFFTTKETGRGTGLGLAIVYGIMKQNGGYVTVKSDVDKGTSVTLYFPLIKAEAARDPSPASMRSVPRGSGTILLAEDDISLRKLARTMLTEFGYTVIEAVDGEDAVNKFRENLDRVGLLILDVIMPRMNGREAYNAIRELRPGIATLFISGYSDDIINRRILVDDGCHFISKPVTPQDLLAKVELILNR